MHLHSLQVFTDHVSWRWFVLFRSLFCTILWHLISKVLLDKFTDRRYRCCDIVFLPQPQSSSREIFPWTCCRVWFHWSWPHHLWGCLPSHWIQLRRDKLCVITFINANARLMSAISYRRVLCRDNITASCRLCPTSGRCYQWMFHFSLSHCSTEIVQGGMFYLSD